MTEKQIRAKLAEHYLAIATLRSRLEEAQRRKRLRCGFCGRQHAVKNLTLIQTHYYIEPYSCTGGDYWKQGKKEYECPSCGERMRDPGDNDYLADGYQFDRKIGELAQYFGARVDEHER